MCDDVSVQAGGLVSSQECTSNSITPMRENIGVHFCLIECTGFPGLDYAMKSKTRVPNVGNVYIYLLMP